MDVWDWVSTSTSVDSLLTTFGGVVLAFLFARDLIITKAQHLRRVADIVAAHEERVADLVAFHARELAEKDARIADVTVSRDQWKEAARLERDRADKATAAVGEMAPAVLGIQHVLESLNRALPSPVGGQDERP